MQISMLGTKFKPFILFFLQWLYFFWASQAVENGWGGARVEVARVGAVQYWVMTSLGQGSGKGGGENIKRLYSRFKFS